MDSNSNKSPRNNNPQQQHLLLSPRNSHSSSSSSGSSNNNNNNNNGLHHHPPSPTTPYPPKPITRSESANPYPTTFVQADTSSFKQVVQMLTGSSDTAKHASSTNYSKPPPPSDKNHHHIPPIKTMPKKQHQQQQHQHQSGFKLYERRNSLKNLNLNPLLPVFSNPNNASGFSPRKHEVLSPSILDFPALVLSPVTPLIPDPFNRSSVSAAVAGGAGYRCGNGSPTLMDAEAEEKAIKEKGFFLHPSPTTTPRDTEPRLLPLFPTTSPRASGSSSSS